MPNAIYCNLDIDLLYILRIYYIEIKCVAQHIHYICTHIYLPILNQNKSDFNNTQMKFN